MHNLDTPITPKFTARLPFSEGLAWNVELPSYLIGDCVEVLVQESSIGVGGVIRELRVRLEVNSTDDADCGEYRWHKELLWVHNSVQQE